MKKLIILVASCLLFCINSQGQHSLGIKTHIGKSKFDNYLSSATNEISKPFSSQTYLLSIFHQLSLKNNYFIGYEIQKLTMNSGETINTRIAELGFNPNSNAVLMEYSRYKLSTVSVPIYFGKRWKRLSSNIGVQCTYFNNSSLERETNIYDQGTILSVVYKRFDITPNKFDFGLRASLSFFMNKAMFLEITTYQGLTPVLISESLYPNKRISHFTMGIGYSIVSQKKEPKNSPN
jgi:hypothetical protein